MVACEVGAQLGINLGPRDWGGYNATLTMVDGTILVVALMFNAAVHGAPQRS
jgi:hypothetical protein